MVCSNLIWIGYHIWIMFDLIYNLAAHFLLFPFFCATKGNFLIWEIRWGSGLPWKYFGWASHIFFGCEILRTSDKRKEESKHCWTLHPNFLSRPNKRRFYFFFYACKRPEREAFTLGGFGHRFLVWKRKGESFSWVSAKPSFLGFGLKHLRREKKKREEHLVSIFLLPSHLLQISIFNL